MFFSSLDEIRLLGMGSEPKARTDKDGNPKLFDGKPTFSLGGIALKPGTDGGRLPGVSVHCLEPVTLLLGRQYVTKGKIFITPYVQSNGFVGMSIVASEIQEAPKEPKELAPRPTREG